MDELIFNHMNIVRGMTEQLIQTIPDEIADVVPNGFRNNIRWNFGHIACVHEKFIFQMLGKASQLPNPFYEFFGPGTNPAQWQSQPPTLTEILTGLSEQKLRTAHILKGHLQEHLLRPFTNKAGFTFRTAGEILLFALYHEALHVENIKRIKHILTLDRVK